MKTPLDIPNMGKPTVQKNVNFKTAFEVGKDIPPTVAAGIATELASGCFGALAGAYFGQMAALISSNG